MQIVVELLIRNGEVGILRVVAAGHGGVIGVGIVQLFRLQADVQNRVAVLQGLHLAGDESGGVYRVAHGEACRIAFGDNGVLSAAAGQTARVLGCARNLTGDQVAVRVGTAQHHFSLHQSEQAAQIGAPLQHPRGVGLGGDHISPDIAHQAAYGTAGQAGLNILDSDDIVGTVLNGNEAVVIAIPFTGQVSTGILQHQRTHGLTRQGAHAVGAGDPEVHQADIGNGGLLVGLAQSPEHTGRACLLHHHTTYNIVDRVILVIHTASQEGADIVVGDGNKGLGLARIRIAVSLHPPIVLIPRHLRRFALEVDVGGLHHGGHIHTGIVQVLEVTARADIGGGSVHGLEQAVEQGGGSCGVQRGIRFKATQAYAAQLRLQLHGHIFAGDHIREQILKLLSLRQLIQHKGVAAVEVAVGGPQRNDSLLADARLLTGEGELQLGHPVLELGGDTDGHLRLQHLGVGDVHGDVQGGIGHCHLAAQNTAAAVVAHAAALPVIVGTVLVGGTAGIPLAKIRGLEFLLAVIHAVYVAVFRIVLNNPMLCLYFLAQRPGGQQQRNRLGGLAVIKDIQACVLDFRGPIGGFERVIGHRQLHQAGDTVGGQAFIAHLFHPAVIGVHFRQPLLGCDIDILRNGVQLILPHGGQQIRSRNSRNTGQNCNNANHHQHFHQGKAPGGFSHPFGCLVSFPENPHVPYSPS